MQLKIPIDSNYYGEMDFDLFNNNLRGCSVRIILLFISNEMADES